MTTTDTSALLAPASLVQQATAAREGRASLADAVNAACDRLEAVEHRIRAFVPEPDRRRRLLDEAQAIDRRFAADARPALYGVLVAIKDIFNVDGLPTRAGSALPAEEFAGPEATSVRRLRKAGALVLGKTITTEFAYFEAGATANPHHTDHTPGGSSSGSAASVAAGIVPLALGSQTVGSVIRPAAFCGDVGFKPTYGRIPSDGILYFSPSVDHAGVFTQSVEDMAAAAALLCDGWSPAPSLEGRTLCVPDGAYLAQADENARAAFEEQIQALDAGGCQVLRVEVMGDIREVSRRHNDLIAAEYAEIHADRYARLGSLFRGRSAMLYETGTRVSDAARQAGLDGRALLRAELEAALREQQADAWVCPAAPGPAPRGLTSTGNPAMNLPWTHAGLPAITLPAGTIDGLPLGLQLCGSFGADETLMSVAQVVESLLIDTD